MSVQQGLRAQMCALVSFYSEERWCEGWAMGIEEEIRAEGGLWLVMAEACGGWPQGLEGKDGWAPLMTNERNHLCAIRGQQPGDQRS